VLRDESRISDLTSFELENQPKVLVTGSGGQIGTELVRALRKLHGVSNVIASDLLPRVTAQEVDGPYEQLDVTDSGMLLQLIKRHRITQVYHLAALLSSKGEKNIDLTWNINFEAYRKLLQVCNETEVNRVFFPSTIGVYGTTTPRHNTPQYTSLQPSTVYGITKITAELWSQYYRTRYGLDVRSLRFPGVISYEVIPEGGTTDFAVEMFFSLKRTGKYTCYLKPDTKLPMIYMPDTIKSVLDLMGAEKSKLSTSMGYNLAGFSLTPAELFNELKQYYPEATISYEPDARQQIADSWSESIDDSLAQQDWGWSPEYDMISMAKDMVKNVV